MQSHVKKLGRIDTRIVEQLGAPPHLDRAISHGLSAHGADVPDRAVHRRARSAKRVGEKSEARPGGLEDQLLPDHVGRWPSDAQDWLGEIAVEMREFKLEVKEGSRCHLDKKMNDDTGLAFMVACAAQVRITRRWDRLDATRSSWRPSRPKRRATADPGGHRPWESNATASIRRNVHEALGGALRKSKSVELKVMKEAAWFRVRSLVSCYLNRDMIGAARAAQKIAATGLDSTSVRRKSAWSGSLIVKRTRVRVQNRRESGSERHPRTVLVSEAPPRPTFLGLVMEYLLIGQGCGTRSTGTTR